MLFRWCRAFEDSGVAAAHTALLIISQVRVLLGGVEVEFYRSGYSSHDGVDLGGVELLATLNHHGGASVPDEHLHGHFGVVTLGVGQIYDCTGDAVGHLVRVAGIYFFKHDLSFYGFNLIAFCPVSFSQRAMITSL